jgi:metal-responsive CopG/Arc/MetJ family transcriptional regulator
MAVKTTIQIDESLAVRLRPLVPPRGLNRFINEAVREKVEALEWKEIEAAMIEGYIASAVDQADVDEDWGAIETEGWPR